MNLRRQILDASRAILIEQGYGALSLRRIAATIGCSATAIYLYFDNRDALVHSLIDEGFDMLYERIARAAQTRVGDGDALEGDAPDGEGDALVGDALDVGAPDGEGRALVRDGDALERLRRIGWEYIAFGLENPEYYEIMFMLNPREMTRFPTERYRRAARTMEPFADVLREGIATGALRPVEPRDFANVVWATLHGGTAVVLARRLDVRIDRERFLRSLLDNALLGVVPDRDDAAGAEGATRVADAHRP